MLNLTRNSGQTIVIDDQIELVVLEVRGDKIKLGLIAPREIPIQREEIRDKLANSPDQTTSATPNRLPNE